MAYNKNLDNQMQDVELNLIVVSIEGFKKFNH
jgi:hypothetical protein